MTNLKHNAARITHRIRLAADQYLEAKFIARDHGLILLKHSENEYEFHRPGHWVLHIWPGDQRFGTGTGDAIPEWVDMWRGVSVAWTLKEIVNSAIRHNHKPGSLPGETRTLGC